MIKMKWGGDWEIKVNLTVNSITTIKSNVHVSFGVNLQLFPEGLDP